ncbi:MAG TPA: ATP-binding protein [Bryobacteraceae bacterium]|nr:ATP-binding protein [Bryobacteraceae bacterium]
MLAWLAGRVRSQDVVWLLLFTLLEAVSPTRSTPEILVVVALAVLQIAEGRVDYLQSNRGSVTAVMLRLALCWLLIGWTGAISSTWYVILLLPVVSAATTLNLAGTLGVTALACLAYASFLLFVDWTRYELTPEGLGEVGLRVIFLPVVGYLTHQLAESNRVEARRYQAAADELERANRSLQEAEAAVRRSERLAALGQLTAGLAHELRNPLGTIRASAELLGRNLPPDNEVGREMTGFIASEVDRMNSLITRFLDFARPVHVHLELRDVVPVIDRVIAELERRNPPLPVSVHRNYAIDTPRIRCDAELLERVVYNLLVNAAEATPPGGTVTVKTRPAGEFCEIAVIDRGSGIAPANLESIFNPFFTTKSTGVGLGLAIVSKIVDEHGGRMAVDSRPGEGSVFRVFLTAASAEVRTGLESEQERTA